MNPQSGTDARGRTVWYTRRVIEARESEVREVLRTWADSRSQVDIREEIERIRNR